MLNRIKADLKEAQLAKDELKVGTLRMLLSETKNAEIAKGGQLSAQDIVRVVQKEVKKRREASEGFRSGGREEQAHKEEAEQKMLEAYLPTQLTNEELTELKEKVRNSL